MTSLLGQPLDLASVRHFYNGNYNIKEGQNAGEFGRFGDFVNNSQEVR